MSWSYYQVGGEIEVWFSCPAGECGGHGHVVSHSAIVNARDRQEAIDLWLGSVPYGRSGIASEDIISVRVAGIPEDIILREWGEAEMFAPEEVCCV